MLRNGQILMLLVACLLVFGVVMVNSAGLDLHGNTNLTDLLVNRQAALAVIAFLCMVAGSLVPVDRLNSLRGVVSPLPWIGLAILAGLVAVHIPGIGREINGAKRWIQIGPIGLQPSEIAKWGIPILLAWYCCRRGESMRRFFAGFALPCAAVAACCGIIALNDLGTAVLIMAVAVGMLVAGGARLLYPLLMAPLLLAGVGLMILVSPYRVNRILAYLDPYSDSQGIGYHIVQSMSAISGGGLAGRGLGNSIQKFGYLPEATTDFIYAIVSEELGVAGTLLVVCLYGGLLLAGLGIIRSRVTSRRETGVCGQRAALSPFCQLLGFGILFTVGMQALINVAVVTGLAPTKGIALPLVSHGGTGWLLTAFSLGLLVSMDRSVATVEDDCSVAEGVAPAA